MKIAFVLYLLLALLAIVFGTGGKSGESSGSESSSSSGSESSSGSGSSSKKSNYYRYTFQSAYYVPYAIDQCSATTLVGDTYIMPTCKDSTHVTVTTYSDPNCTTSTLSTEYNSSTGVFRCDGSDTYMEIITGIDDCSTTFYAAIDTCIKHGLTTSTYVTYSCSSTTGNIKFYTSATCNNTASTTYNLNATCEFGFASSGYDIFWNVDSCSASSSSVTTTASSGESSSTGSESSSSESTSSESTSSESTSSESTSSESTSSESGGESTTGTSSIGNMIALNNIVAIGIIIIGSSFILF